jgi:hypothetical protein
VHGTYRCDELIAAFGKRDDVAIVGRIAQHLAQSGHLPGQVAFFDDRVTPHFGDERVLVDWFSRVTHEGDEDVEHTGGDRNRNAVAHQPAVRGLEDVRSERTVRRDWLFLGRHRLSRNSDIFQSFPTR